MKLFYAVMADDAEQRAVRAVDILELGVENGIDPVLTAQRTEAVLPPPSGEGRVLVGGRLRVKVELRCPPGPHAVLELEGGADEGVPAFREAGDVLHSQLKVPGLLHLVGV